jgi:hypothetical protein
VNVWTGKGEGTFNPPVTGYIQDPGELAVADFTGDGNLDIARLNENCRQAASSSAKTRRHFKQRRR